MTRLIIASTVPGPEVKITSEFVRGIQEGLGGILQREFGALEIKPEREVPYTIPDYGDIQVQTYEIPNKGAVILTGEVLAENVPSDYLKSIVNLIGVQEMWEPGSDLAKRVKAYFEEQSMVLRNDEIITAEGTQYIEGANNSNYMKLKHGTQLLNE